jgi:hypothetical protein
MKTTFINLSIISFVCLPLLLPAQLNCPEFFRYHTSGAVEYPWKRDSQSKTGFFTKGQSSVLKIVLYEGKDYKIRFFQSALDNQTAYKVKVNGQQVYSLDPTEANNAANVIAEKRSALEKLIATLESLSGKKLQQVQAQVDALKAEIAKLEADYYKKYSDSSGAQQASCNLSVTSTVDCEIEVNVLDVQKNTNTCIGILIMNRISPKIGF